MKRLPLALLCASMLAGCGVNREMPPPSIPQARSYTAKSELLSLNQRITLGERITAQWWTLFASRPLNHLIRTGVASNYDLAAARETLAQAQEAVTASQAGLLPQISLGAAMGRQKYGAALFGPADFTIPPFSYYEAGPSLSWTPDLFGRQRYAIARQQALADYQSHRLDAVYIALTANIVTETLDLASLNEEIAAARRIQKEDEKTLELVKAAYSLGSASRLDVLGAQTQLVTDSAMLPPLEHRRAISRHALAILFGKAPAAWSPPDIELKDFILPKALPLRLPSELVRQRPDILAAEDNLRAASAAVGEARTGFYPSITLTANMMQEALTPAGIFKSAANAWSLAAGLSAPIFNGGALTAEKRAAQHAYRAALAQYRQTILNAFAQVADALTSLDHDDEALAMSQDAVNQARSTYDLTLAGYQSGAVGLLQVQDTQRTLAKAELEFIASQQQRYLDCVRLFVALGGSPYKGKT